MRTPRVQLVALDPLGASSVRAVTTALSHMTPALEILVLGTSDERPSRTRRVERLIYTADAESDLACVVGASLSVVDIAIGCVTERSCQLWLPRLAEADATLNCALHCVLRIPPCAHVDDVRRALPEGLASVHAVSTRRATVAVGAALVEAHLGLAERARARRDFVA